MRPRGVWISWAVWRQNLKLPFKNVMTLTSLMRSLLTSRMPSLLKMKSPRRTRSCLKTIHFSEMLQIMKRCSSSLMNPLQMSWMQELPRHCCKQCPNLGVCSILRCGSNGVDRQCCRTPITSAKRPRDSMVSVPYWCLRGFYVHVICFLLRDASIFFHFQGVMIADILWSWYLLPH